jgi:hypothetical protein
MAAKDPHIRRLSARVAALTRWAQAADDPDTAARWLQRAHEIRLEMHLASARVAAAEAAIEVERAERELETLETAGPGQR